MELIVFWIVDYECKCVKYLLSVVCFVVLNWNGLVVVSLDFMIGWNGKEIDLYFFLM